VSEIDRNRFYEIRNAFLEDVAAASALVEADRTLLDVRSGIGETPLHWLVVEDVIPAVTELIRLGAEVDCTNEFGATALMEAAQLGYIEMCGLLLAHGASPRYMSSRGESPLCHAARSRQIETLQVLLTRFEDSEDLRPYFDDLDLDMIFDISDTVTDLLRSRGLAPIPKDYYD
jgi:ankyrin repeat protein